MATSSTSGANAAAPPQQSPVVVHRFYGVSENGEKVCLSAADAFLDTVSELCGTEGMVFEDASLPEVAALGSLPAGFAEGRPLATEALLQLSRRHAASVLAAMQSSVVPPEVEAWAAWIEDVFTTVSTFVLWAHPPCFRSYTRPCIVRGVRGGCASRTLARWHCRQLRREAQNGTPVKRRGRMWTRRQHDSAELEQQRAWEKISHGFYTLLAELQARLSVQPFLHGEKPQLSDIVLLSHARVLLSVPLAVTPWHCDELRTTLDGLKAFVDRLSCLSSWMAGPGIRPAPHIGTWASSSLIWEAHHELESADFVEDDEDVETKVSASSTRAPAPRRRGLARALAAPQPPSSAPPRLSEWSSSLGSHWRNFKAAVSRLAPESQQGGPDRSSSSSSERQQKDTDALSIVQQRRNVMFLVWCAASMVALKMWTRRQQRLAS